MLKKALPNRIPTFGHCLALPLSKSGLDQGQADRLLVQVCLEAALTYPIETARLFLEKGLEVYLNPWMLVVPVHPQFPPEFFHPPVSNEIAAAGDYTNTSE